jgi:hypothetical protein
LRAFLPSGAKKIVPWPCGRCAWASGQRVMLGACVSVDMRAIESVSFASSDFKLRIRAQLFLPRMGYFCRLATHNIRIKFQMSPNCHFDSLNLVRNSNLEFEFMHKIRATERATRASWTYSWILPTRPGSKVAVFARHHTLALSPRGAAGWRPRFGR